VDCLETFRMIAEMGEESLGAYVISMAKRPSDVLAVNLLMKEYGLKRCVRVCLSLSRNGAVAARPLDRRSLRLPSSRVTRLSQARSPDTHTPTHSNMRVAPLFETLDDLNKSAETVETLFTHPW
jgi:phosphoenolpyruvate carboxylase